MGKNNNKQRAEQLGMSYGAANHKLKKNLMFKFAQMLDFDNCYACGEKIQTPTDLSVEHKEPWEGRENGVEKFWDLDNIAFSHLKCNIPHVQGGYKHRKIGKEGTAWCGSCQDFLSVNLFRKDSTRWNGVDSVCNACRKKKRAAMD